MDSTTDSCELREKLNNLHWNQKQSLHQMARELGIDRRTLRRLMRKLGVPTRSYDDTVKLRTKTNSITSELLNELYWNRRLSSTHIGKVLGISPGYVRKLMERYRVARRTTSEAGMKYQKSHFSRNIHEKAYMTGLRTGDLNVDIYGYQVRVATTTTHPAMWRLINNVFGGYGHVGKSAALSNGQFEWCVYCYLDRSFDFLLPKPQKIPSNIFEDEDCFLSFLAGYIDAEGSLRIYGDDDTAAVSLRINSEDEQILRQISHRLKSMGYHCRFALAAKGGRNTRYRRDLWTIGLFRKHEILDLLGRIPILHDEKVRASKLVMKCGHLGWNEIRREVSKLKSAIRNEVTSFTEEAKSRYLTKHNGQLA